MARRDLIEERIARLVAEFGRYVTAYDRLVPFSADQLAAHRQTIDLRRRAPSVRAAAEDPRFVASLRRTLLAWGIGGRGSVLRPHEEFATALRAAAPGLSDLEPLTIDAADPPADLADRLWAAIDSLGVVDNKAKLVAGTKTMHHLLPDLVMPMDRFWTGRFFQLHPPEWQDSVGQRRTFRRVYGHLADVARRTKPYQYATGEGWRTSRTKILDNALIGFCRLETNDQPSAAKPAPNTVSFSVAGYPPAKNEARSLFNSGHTYAKRVRDLLDTAERACQKQGFTPIAEGGVGLDVIVHAAADQPPWDATNYLGGIADVLEDKSRRGPLEYLGKLASVWLYRNDRQIREITYRQVGSSQAAYTVTLRALTPPDAISDVGRDPDPTPVPG